MKIIIKLILFLFIIGGLLYFYYQYQINAGLGTSEEEKVFAIEEGEGVKAIGAKLEAAGLIRSAFWFEIFIWGEGSQSDLKAGEYSLPGGLSMREIAAALIAGGKNTREEIIRLIEGWNSRDIDKYLKEQNILADNSYYELAAAPVSGWTFVFARPDYLDGAPAGASLEGYLFPDTYRIYSPAKAGDIIAKQLANFGWKLTPEMRAEISAQGKTIHEIVTMASLVEKEVKTEDDMKIVAGIFWDRIKYGQPLESCATLAYILGVNKAQYSFEDTRIQSPYNTYLNRGLPPGPIANPGLKAIMAAIYPVYTEYNYFLSRPDTGETVFSKTFAEHNQNKTRYLR